MISGASVVFDEITVF